MQALVRSEPTSSFARRSHRRSRSITTEWLSGSAREPTNVPILTRMKGRSSDSGPNPANVAVLVAVAVLVSSVLMFRRAQRPAHLLSTLAIPRHVDTVVPISWTRWITSPTRSTGIATIRPISFTPLAPAETSATMDRRHFPNDPSSSLPAGRTSSWS